MIMKFNLGLLALVVGAFGIGVTEFAPMGMLPVIAADLQVSIPAAGLLVSAYAIGVLMGAPLMALTTGWSSGGPPLNRCSASTCPSRRTSSERSRGRRLAWATVSARMALSKPRVSTGRDTAACRGAGAASQPLVRRSASAQAYRFTASSQSEAIAGTWRALRPAANGRDRPSG